MHLLPASTCLTYVMEEMTVVMDGMRRIVLTQVTTVEAIVEEWQIWNCPILIYLTNTKK